LVNGGLIVAGNHHPGPVVAYFYQATWRKPSKPVKVCPSMNAGWKTRPSATEGILPWSLTRLKDCELILQFAPILPASLNRS
jgi:hypothetical protein